MALQINKLSLFRNEVVENKQSRLYGSVILANSKITLPVFLGIVSFSILIIGYVLIFDYSRKTVVDGVISTSSGIINITPKYNGIVANIFFKEGQFVNEGDSLFSVVSEDFYDHSHSNLVQILTELKSQEDNLIDEIKKNKELLLNFKKMSSLKIEITKEKNEFLKSQSFLIKKRLANKEDIVIASYKLLQKGFLNSIDYSVLNDELIELELTLEENKSSLYLTKKSIDEIELSEYEYETKIKQSNNQILNDISDKRKEILQIQNSGEKTIKATRGGKIDTINVHTGDYIGESNVLATILPYGSELIAELAITTRSSAFVSNGDSVQLQIDAFPYQTFGFVKGKIYYISDTVRIADKKASIGYFTEPYYTSRVRLNKQYLLINSEKIQLKSGMKFKADIIHERKSVFKWLIDKLNSTKLQSNT